MTASNLISSFLRDMEERGLIHQSTDLIGLDQQLTKGRITAYVGFDATADSLHAGHLLSLMTMRRLLKHSHNVIALIGGTTTLVGDPSFRSESRPMLNETAVARNIEGIRANIMRVLEGHTEGLMILDNSEWLGDANLIKFMRDIGSNFTLARLLSMDAVKRRLDDGLSVLELCYTMLQATDFLELARRHGCVLQMGGSDQWGNIVNGIELARRMDGKNLIGLTTPLLTTSSGQKMGKTTSGAIWLAAEKLSEFKFWQFWRNVPDVDVRKLMLMLTEFSVGEIEALCAGDINNAKATLASALTSLVHGQAEAIRCHDAALQLFSGERPSAAERIAIEGEEIGLATLMVQIGLCKTTSEGRRLIETKAIKIDGVVIEDWRQKIMRGHELVISCGKRNRIFVKID